VTSVKLDLLALGATSGIGRLVVAEGLPHEAQRVVGDLTRPETLSAAVDGINPIVFAHGSNGGQAAAEHVDYGAVRKLLQALGGRRARITLLTAIGVTNRQGDYNRSTQIHDWKRRAGRLVRASGLPYTIVRPGWFDYNEADQRRLVLLQGDTRQAGDPSDGVISRRQRAGVLVSSPTRLAHWTACETSPTCPWRTSRPPCATT